MTRSLQVGTLVRFGPYEVNLESGDLRKLGCRVLLQPKSFLVLRSLLGRPGELVTREELKAQLWPGNTFVEFDSSLNVAVRRLRQALCDEAQNPVYIQTDPRHGYRFVGPVETPYHYGATAPDIDPTAPSWFHLQEPVSGSFGSRYAPDSGALGVPRLISPRWTWNSWKAIVPALALLVALAIGILWRSHDLLRRSSAPSTPSIAVLPFVDDSPEKNQQYFSDGLAEELLNELAKTPELRVAARTSSFQFKPGSADLHAVGEKLNVATVLEGTVRKAGNRIRISAELINVHNGFQLWSSSYERDLGDVFAVQEEIARAVSAELKVKLLSHSPSAATPQSTSTDAYNDYLQGRYFSERRTRTDLERASNYYEQAIRLDPNYAPAWSGLAWVRLRQANAGYEANFEKGSRLAREAAEKALKLNPGLAEPYAALGWIQRSHDWDWSAANASFQKALALEPRNTIVLLGASRLAASLGRLQEALALNRRAVELDPLSVTAHIYLGLHAYCAGQMDLSVEAYRKALEINPDDPDAHYLLSLVDLQRSEPAQALAELAKENRELERWVGESLAYDALGRRQDSDRILAKIIATSAQEAAYQIAEVYAFRGQTDLAFHWLERAWSQRDMGLPGFQNDPLIKSLHADPRFAVFLKKMNVD
jgi:TolB-like protein/DNA-binding winged helix-turn-helix (wHTH) protein/Tfp pilus assembly protein PilF